MIDDAANRGEKRRPLPQYRLKIAYGPYAKGAIITPTEPLRSVLKQRGVIELVDAPGRQQELLPPAGIAHRARRGR